MAESPKLPDEAPPPLLGRWRNLYALVLSALALWILLFLLFERSFE